MKQRVGIQGADNIHQGITSATASPSGKCKIDSNIVHSPPPHAPSTQQLRHDMLPIPFTPPNAASSQIYQFIPFPPIPISRLVPPPRKYQSSQHGTLPPLDDRKKKKKKKTPSAIPPADPPSSKAKPKQPVDCQPEPGQEPADAM